MKPIKRELRIFSIPLLLCMCGCQTNLHKSSATGDGTEEEMLEHPLLTAEVIQLSGRSQLSAVSGTCYIIRQESASEIAQVGEVLRDGDLMDFGNDCRATISTTNKSTINLSRDNGRFFRIELSAADE